MRSILGLLIIIISTGTALAQSETNLKQYFEGRSVTLKIDLPATSDGVNVYPERSQPFDYNEYADRLKRHGASVRRGSDLTITKVKVKAKHIEIQLGGGDYEALSGRSRFNVHFKQMDSLTMSPSAIVDALRKYLEFEGAAERVALPQPLGVSVRHGVVRFGPRTTYLKEGLSTREVLRLLGEPSAVNERIVEGALVTTYEFIRSEGRIIVAEFVGDVLIRSTTETRSSHSTVTDFARLRG